jgi:hypothetical protein
MEHPQVELSGSDASLKCAAIWWQQRRLTAGKCLNSYIYVARFGVFRQAATLKSLPILLYRRRDFVYRHRTDEMGSRIKAAKGGANPIVGDVISQAMERVQGVMILFSPDEEAKIRPKLASQSDKIKDLHLKGFQPRPNVIFEAGLALGAHSDKTILVQVGSVRDISDISGKHMVYRRPQEVG